MQTFRAPARIPLYLRVVGLNDDGSPQMIALNQTIDLCDHLLVESADSDQLPQQHREICEAVKAYREYTGESFPVTIKLQTNLPEHADLGQRYSHAATVLWALNQISPHPIDEKGLKEIAKRIHSDVLFFFTRGTAKCSSKGEIYDEQAPSENKAFWLVCPSYSLPSEKIYKRFSIQDLQGQTLENSLDRMILDKADYCNDLEDSAFALDPKLALRKQRIKDLGFQTVVMAGTGPILYCMDGPTHPSTQEESYKTQYINRKEGSWY